MKQESRKCSKSQLMLNWNGCSSSNSILFFSTDFVEMKWRRKNIISRCATFLALFFFLFNFMSFVQVIIKGLTEESMWAWGKKKKVKWWKLYIILWRFLYIINRALQWNFYSISSQRRFHKHYNFFYFLLNSHKSFNCYFVLYKLIRYL